MKLINKKTSEIYEAEAREDGIYLKANWSDKEQWFRYGLETLASGWDYYVEPKEPLIKNEKIRKAVRAWLSIQEQPIAEVSITCFADDYGFFNYYLCGYVKEARIGIAFDFRSLEKIEFVRGKYYTITELCGEEEE